MIQANRHMCYIYEGDANAHLPRIFALLMDKLKQGYRCLMLGSDRSLARTRSKLAVMGLDVAGEIDNGALILSSNQDHVERGEFSPDRLVHTFAKAARQATKDGFKGLWASGDIAWEVGAAHNLPALLDYESALDKLVQSLPTLSGVCQYRKDALPLYAVGHAILTHPALYWNHLLHKTNPFHESPDRLLQAAYKAPTSHHIESMIHRLHSAR